MSTNPYYVKRTSKWDFLSNGITMALQGYLAAQQIKDTKQRQAEEQRSLERARLYQEERDKERERLAQNADVRAQETHEQTLEAGRGAAEDRKAARAREQRGILPLSEQVAMAEKGVAVEPSFRPEPLEDSGSVLSQTDRQLNAEALRNIGATRQITQQARRKELETQVNRVRTELRELVKAGDSGQARARYEAAPEEIRKALGPDPLKAAYEDQTREQFAEAASQFRTAMSPILTEGIATDKPGKLTTQYEYFVPQYEMLLANQRYLSSAERNWLRGVDRVMQRLTQEYGAQESPEVAKALGRAQEEVKAGKTPESSYIAGILSLESTPSNVQESAMVQQALRSYREQLTTVRQSAAGLVRPTELEPMVRDIGVRQGYDGEALEDFVDTKVAEFTTAGLRKAVGAEMSPEDKQREVVAMIEFVEEFTGAPLNPTVRQGLLYQLTAGPIPSSVQDIAFRGPATQAILKLMDEAVQSGNLDAYQQLRGVLSAVNSDLFNAGVQEKLQDARLKATETNEQARNAARQPDKTNPMLQQVMELLVTRDPVLWRPLVTVSLGGTINYKWNAPPDAEHQASLVAALYDLSEEGGGIRSSLLPYLTGAFGVKTAQQVRQLLEKQGVAIRATGQAGVDVYGDQQRSTPAAPAATPLPEDLGAVFLRAQAEAPRVLDIIRKRAGQGGVAGMMNRLVGSAKEREKQIADDLREFYGGLGIDRSNQEELQTRHPQLYQLLDNFDKEIKKLVPAYETPEQPIGGSSSGTSAAPQTEQEAIATLNQRFPNLSANDRRMLLSLWRAQRGGVVQPGPYRTA